MVRYLVLFALTIGSLTANANDIDMKAFAQTYFDAAVKTQQPGASAEDIEAYLALLTDDVGHTHLPWYNDDSREPDGKAQMRKGMMFYLGAHSHYHAELLNVFTFNQSAIAIRYRHSAKGVRPDTKEPVEYESVMMELLELENGKVAVIRKNHE
ncbi:nuclear transport factor 2 family protein [Simiduia agarivorans]|uniref:SnoaL-like domain-containing protein n=1 Tax=Simiduia agarivorans (strain DSM 21679 / JCM 13881 / BCRC 17597 / SA1) TaxID=1117647 RepID=K4KX58_SIMAS|nr:nuclear transport factor 2 family protein [Simiduia agarivorans]AFU98522.1 hypothetical protein M5M_06635 [Simiduia agarivorans SA1 = DSM 21679]